MKWNQHQLGNTSITRLRRWKCFVFCNFTWIRAILIPNNNTNVWDLWWIFVGTNVKILHHSCCYYYLIAGVDGCVRRLLIFDRIIWVHRTHWVNGILSMKQASSWNQQTTNPFYGQAIPPHCSFYESFDFWHGTNEVLRFSMEIIIKGSFNAAFTNIHANINHKKKTIKYFAIFTIFCAAHAFKCGKLLFDSTNKANCVFLRRTHCACHPPNVWKCSVCMIFFIIAPFEMASNTEIDQFEFINHGCNAYVNADKKDK